MFLVQSSYMQITDRAILLTLTRYSEHAAVVHALTESHGLYSGLAKGALGKTHRGTFQPGNIVALTWKARLPEHMGTISAELAEPLAAHLMHDAQVLAALQSVAALITRLLPERMAYPALFRDVYALLRMMTNSPPREGGQDRNAIRGGQVQRLYNQENITYAKQMRKALTPAEFKLWMHLKRHNREGWKFRRQQPIGPYIVDFYQADAGLIIEIDGGQHNESERIAYDKVRTEFLESSGYRILRFWNNEVLKNIEGVMQVLEQEMRTSPPGSLRDPAPPHGGGYSSPASLLPHWLPAYARFELDLLETAGYGLDLSQCAATGSMEELHYVSPRSGRAVSREAGMPYREKLFALPGFFLPNGRNSAISHAEMLDGLRLTGYFLESRALAAKGRKMPQARGRLMKILQPGNVKANELVVQ